MFEAAVVRQAGFLFVLLAACCCSLSPASAQPAAAARQPSDNADPTCIAGPCLQQGVLAAGESAASACPVSSCYDLMSMNPYPRGADEILSLVGPIWLLDLNADQRERISNLWAQLAIKMWQTTSQILQRSSKLRRLYEAQSLDAKEIGVTYGQIFDLRRQLIESEVETVNAVRAALSPEQNKRLEALRGERFINHGDGVREGRQGR